MNASAAWNTAAIEAQKQALLGSNWKLLPDKLELCVSDEACCLALARKIGFAPVSQYSIKLVKEGQSSATVVLGNKA
ncbi:hypothetical protein WJX82_006794 [Trebouxia sp. C0006]